ncbi:Lar family restriction alleviation protein [Burkholderia multivorans]|uniref:Lar family restriction alleviation protein n=1 Tax=Burkholderia multivorans TaxID=87883 RepID=UPI001C230335|nr:Lar family restriction alleviation protein [Burkholderia multivorans]
MSELKSCPFCSGIPRVDGYHRWMVSCLNLMCGSKGPVRRSRDEAIDAWNRRAPVSEGEQK